MGKEQVLKIPGIAIEKFGEFAKKFGKEAKELSSEVKTFDVISGYASKNGNFNIFTFKDAHGNILSKDFQFGERSFTRIYARDKNCLGERGLAMMETTDADIKDVKITSLIDRGSSFFCSKEFYTGTGTDTACIARLEEGKPKRKITIKTKWDGAAPDIEYNNTLGELRNQDLELLPLVMDTYSIRGKEKINHIADIFENKHRLKGVIPRPKIYTSDYLEKAFGSRKGCCLFDTGEVRIGTDVANSSSVMILDTCAHEYWHAKDYSDVLRLKSLINEYYKYVKKKEFSPERLKFIKKSMAKGRIRDNSMLGQILGKIRYEMDHYNELCKKIGHDNLISEDRAINAEIDAVTRFVNIVKEVFSIIGF